LTASWWRTWRWAGISAKATCIAWRIVDAKTGPLERGELRIEHLRSHQAWSVTVNQIE
jgi:hypothetical protein